MLNILSSCFPFLPDPSPHYRILWKENKVHACEQKCYKEIEIDEKTLTHMKNFLEGICSFLGPSGDLPVFSLMMGASLFPLGREKRCRENEGEFSLFPSSGRGFTWAGGFPFFPTVILVLGRGVLGLWEQQLYLGEHLVVLPQQ